MCATVIRTVVLEAEAEFGYPQWGMGEHSIAFLGDGRIACHYDRDGATHTAIVDPETGELVDLDLPLDALRWGPGSGPRAPPSCSRPGRQPNRIR